MITPEEIRERALRLWNRQDFLRAHLEGRPLFPLDIPFAKPTAAELAGRFTEVRDWIKRLKTSSKDILGYGYRILYRDVNHQRLGAQSLPARIVLETAEDCLRLAGKRKDFERFDHQVAAILREWPALKPYFVHHPLIILEHLSDWDKILAICRYFLEHPLPMVYARQLDIIGVDTKFIETHRGLLGDLLDILLPEAAWSEGPGRTGDHAFERRFGLRFETPLLRFRLLDDTLATAGWTDIALPLPDFERLSFPVRRVFIVENKINGLAFPPHPESLVLFGLGYGVNLLIGASWLAKADVHYWGDIDTHGFAILNRLRTIWPHAHSFLMDRETLETFRSLWGQEDPGRRFTGDLTQLRPEERALYEALRGNHLGERIRLEQERISWGYLQTRLRALEDMKNLSNSPRSS